MMFYLLLFELVTNIDQYSTTLQEWSNRLPKLPPLKKLMIGKIDFQTPQQCKYTTSRYLLDQSQQWNGNIKTMFRICSK